jgi:DnaJ-class molecular chaperone
MELNIKQELSALVKVIDEMDYYQILKVDQKAFTEQIKHAYFDQSRKFHPDKYYQEDPEVVEMVSKVFKRTCEAYKVLSDANKRASYTKAINTPDRKKFLRYDPKIVDTAKKGPENEGTTSMGRKYYQMAKTGLQNKDYNSAKINLQLAIKMEPANETFKSRLQEVEEILKLRKKKV